MAKNASLLIYLRCNDSEIDEFSHIKLTAEGKTLDVFGKNITHITDERTNETVILVNNLYIKPLNEELYLTKNDFKTAYYSSSAELCFNQNHDNIIYHTAYLSGKQFKQSADVHYYYKYIACKDQLEVNIPRKLFSSITLKQWHFIICLENKYNVRFEGFTKVDAIKFISLYKERLDRENQEKWSRRKTYWNSQGRYNNHRTVHNGEDYCVWDPYLAWERPELY